MVRFNLSLFLLLAHQASGFHAGGAPSRTSLGYRSENNFGSFYENPEELTYAEWEARERRAPSAQYEATQPVAAQSYAMDDVKEEEDEEEYWSPYEQEIPPTPSLELLQAWTQEFVDAVDLAGGMTRVSVGVQNMLAEEFVFTSPNIGPLNKPDYIKLMGYYQNKGLDLASAIPDLQVTYDGWHVDPHQPWRIWAVARYSGTHLGTATVPDSNLRLTPPNKEKRPVFFTSGPEVQSFLWTPEKKVLWHTMGYVGDEYTGTNKGYGGLDGLLVSMGLPALYLDAISPFRRAKTWLSQFQSDNGETSARAQTRFSKLPQWWNDRKYYGLNIHK
mmetsp:Transcript_108050/g.312225  ORF Transcript_108050/g.312225 Transcript_108050/m.312225 type:complete len:331 (-) Transcript_108050:121-1113(-)